MHALALVLLLSTGCGDVDADADGFPASQDCDDSNREVNPLAPEIPYDGLNNDCRDETLDDDLDQDGFGIDVDCNDEEERMNPNATEACDGLDNNCDEIIDNGTGTPHWADEDGDGFGDNATQILLCTAQEGYVPNDDDCDDDDDGINPDAIEVCNEIDDDCDGAVDNNAQDAITLNIDFDGDAFGSTLYQLLSCEGLIDGWVTDNTDCDDADPNQNPSADETCNGEDDDCNFQTDEGLSGVTEICNNLDDDCDGSIDEDAGDVWYLDYDGDGAGDDARSTLACTQPSPDHVMTGGDADDTDSGVQ